MARSAELPSARKAWLLALLMATACEGGSGDANLLGTAASAQSQGDGTAVPPCDDSQDCNQQPSSAQPSSPQPKSACRQLIAIYEDGESNQQICADDAADAGLTIVDLADDWAPGVLAGGADGSVPYRETYVRLANEQFGDDPVWDRARHDRYLEVYGIFPTLTVIKARMADDDRHGCHVAVDNRGLVELTHDVDTWKPLAEQRGDLGAAEVIDKKLTASLDPAAGLANIEDFEGNKGLLGALYAKRRKILSRHAGIAAMKQHLRCEGLYEGSTDGFMGHEVIDAMQRFHRRHMIISWQLDEETRRALMADTRELDFLTLLRTLRERVVDATQLIEDGTAAGTSAEVVGRQIDTDVFVDDSRGEALEGAALDLVGQATDTAARALGWTSPAAALAFLEADQVPQLVAVRLPDPPAYHAKHMALNIVIDRGDVWYDFPFTGRGDRFVQPRENKPATILYAEHEGQRVPLVRWPTTIGGWQPERVGGRTKLMYKESPTGPRVIRDIVAAPRWIPPTSTPTRDLLRPRGKGVWVPKYDSFGPHYASAYGIAMMIHHRVDQPPSGEPIFTDQGIRSHGSASYDSILDGFSHGCHRLHNHRAVRLTSFLIAHRNHVVRGPIELDFYRTLYFRRTRTNLHFESRGYRYELTPPIEVDVLRGRVMGRHTGPPLPRGLPAKLLRRYGFR